VQTIPFKTNFFAEDESPARTDALAGDSHADVVIVGAGIVGLACAYTLREEGLDVALLEREHVGYASSGRHLGNLTPHMWSMGEEQPQLLAAWAQDCLDETEKLLAAERIECGFRRCPYWMPAVRESDAEEVPRWAEYFAQLGLPARLVEAGKFELVTYETYGAMVLEDQARVDPYRMVRGMREAVLRKGVRLYEGTPVEAIEGGAEVLVTTPGGTLRAPKAVLALNAYSGQFPFLQEYVSPSHTYAIATAPLDESTAKTVGPANDDIVFDFGGRLHPHYYQRFRPDRRLIFGGGMPTLAPAPDRLAPDHNDEAFRDIHAEMIRRYPALETVAVEAGWGGSICQTVNGLPIIVEVPEHENLILAVVGNGNGMGLGPSVGRLVKGLVLGVDKLDARTRAFLEFCGGPR
jgi:glycine/D-amino acid oxidase-like deaminating enzyme